jgi:hypothetical protein
VPDKRQTSKQRRASRNRASRGALAARRSNALSSPTTSSSSRSSGAGSSPVAAASASSGATGGGSTAGGLLGVLRGPRRPGDLAVFIALALAVVSAVSVLFFTKVPVDDRGEPLPRMFQGVAVAAREAFTGQPVPDHKETLLQASGPGVLLYLALPIAVAAFAFWANRRPDRSRLLTFAMLAMAGVVILAGGFVFFPTLIAMAVASFQVRKADMPARVAERVAPTGRGRGGVIDAESEEVEDEPSDVVDDADEVADDTADGVTADDGGADPLAELEAEIEAEDRAGRRRGGDAPGAATSGE